MRLLCFLLFLLPAGLRAQPLQLPAQSFTADQGLGGATITSLMEDARGFLWVGTPDELLLYDGRQFVPFHYPDSGGNARSFRRAVVLQTGNSGFLILHEEGAHQSEGDRLFPVPAPFRHTAALATQSFRPDSTTRGRYRFVSSYARGCYLPHLRQWQSARQWKDPIPVAVWENGSEDAHYLGQSESKPEKTLLAPFTQRATAQFSAPFKIAAAVQLAGGLLLLSNEAVPRLWWKRAGGEATVIATPPVPAGTLKATTAGKTVYVAVGASLFAFNPESGSLRTIQNESGGPLVPKGIISHLLLRGSTLWGGTNAAGLLRVSLEGHRFGHIRSAVPAHNFIQAILPAGENLFTGAFYGAFVRYDGEGNFQEDLSRYLKPPFTGRATYYFNHLEELPSGALFIMGGRSAYLFHPAQKTVTDLTPSYEQALAQSGLSPDKEPGRKTVVAAGNQSWWMTAAGGLHLWALTGGGPATQMQLRRSVSLAGLPAEGICLWNNNVWAATAGKLYRLNKKGIADSFPLPLKTLVTCLQPDRLDRLWIATESGLLVWQNGQVLKMLTTEAGLPNNHIYKLLSDRAGNLWGSTNGGLFAVNTQNFTVQAFSMGEGLQGAEFNSGAAATDSAGRLYFGGMAGVNRFAPAAVLQAPPAHKVTITRLTGPDTVYASYPAGTGVPHLQLAPNRGSLLLNYTAPFASENACEYRLNKDESWTPAGSGGALQLALAPGRYAIEVRLRGQPASVAAVQVAVRPPFYQTTSFLVGAFLLVALLLAGGLFFVSKMRYRRQVAALETARRVQAEKERISRELHDELGARAALIAHNASQLLVAARQGTHLLPLAHRIEDTTTDMLLALRETVWTLKQETVTAGSLWLRYKNFVAKLSETYTHLSFSITEEGTFAQRPLHYTQALNALRILQEATANAVRHAGGNNITAAAQFEDGKTCFSLSDNGSGFDFEAALHQSLGNGLHNMVQRSGESDLNLIVNTLSAGGTEVKICF